METATIKQNRTTAVSYEYNTQIKVYFKNTIGKGTFGKVKYCVAKVNNKTIGFAVKIINKKSSICQCNKSAIKREIIISKKVNHPNLIKFIKIIIHNHYVYMYMEYCKNGDMCKTVEKYGPYVEHDACFLFSQIVAAIEYLHSLDIAHRDLKPENILLNHQNEVKVADFGLSIFCRESLSDKRILLLSCCGTRMFMPPEVLMSSKNGYNAKFFDIWSMGGVLHFMLTGQVPFDDGSVKQIVAQQVSGDIVLLRPTYKRTVSSPAKQLVRHMLEPDVLKRARIAVIKRSKWMTMMT
ncbi:CBL-interacting protein kinase 1-like [Melanaphis sacchari]|uniref:CBL-interacting protein kinase 1-like n=1 Tax=Melanaphis sacchari TaxID=742174 RepID=UPI000DC1350F|nr:CBL-interacting protein kinase 1-like [Melanaphis sacchari]